MTAIDRRRFLGLAAAAPLSLHTAASRRSIPGANERVTLAVLGTNARGSRLARDFARLEGARVAYVCDPDERAFAKAAAALAKVDAPRPKFERDIRRVLDDPDIDAVVVATPDHWHALATVWACAAGKHVYVEKPVSHSPREGERMIAAAAEHDRVIQCGMQRRSAGVIRELVDELRGGSIGKLRYARGWYANRRPTIGRGAPAAVPSSLDWDLWQGPAPRREFRSNVVHYHWHWFWHWGTGELGNNGIHALDICRWGLGVGHPRRVSAGGGVYHYNDDQQTPDTMIATWDYGDVGIGWEHRNWHPHRAEGSKFGFAFYGDGGAAISDGAGYRVLDMDGEERHARRGDRGDTTHLTDFLAAIRGEKQPNASIEDGHASTLMCHLGNIAHRTGTTLSIDPASGRIRGGGAAAKLERREYARGFEL